MSKSFEARDGVASARPKLRWKERRAGYSMARRAWVRHGESLLGMTDGERKEALRSVADDPQAIDIATILLILKMAIELWQWWNKEKTTSPPEKPGMAESGIIAAGGTAEDDE